MPDYTFYYDTTPASTDAISGDMTCDEVLRMWKDYGLSVDRDEEQRLQEEAELREDKRKYPLFFIKEGIV